jgi:hypothetical protein
MANIKRIYDDNDCDIRGNEYGNAAVASADKDDGDNNGVVE